MKIVHVVGTEIYDSRGFPTLECSIELEDGAFFTGHAPSDGLQSPYAAVNLHDKDSRLWGYGARKAIAVIENIVAPVLIGKEPMVPELDYALISLDGTDDKSVLGANVLLATSIALYKAYAYCNDIELYELFALLTGATTVTLPCPQITLINGGYLSQGLLATHELMMAPVGAATLREALDFCIKLFHEIKSALHHSNKLAGYSSDGALTTSFTDDREMLDLVTSVLERFVAQEEGACALALNVSANTMYDQNSHTYALANSYLTSEELIHFYSQLVNTYPIYSLEDGMSQTDRQGWLLLIQALGDKVQIVSGDICATNPERIVELISSAQATTVRIKPNEVGTITETLQVIDLCKRNNIGTLLASSLGETEDAFIADLALGTNAGQLKVGGCLHSERMAKYNRLVAIEEALRTMR
jgi:enolase